MLSIRPVRPTLALALAILVLAGLAAPAFAAEPPGAATPEALVARMEAAAAKSDLAELAACVVPEDRAQLTVAMVAMTGMLVAFSQMGGEMAGEMAEGMAEGMGGELSAEDRARMEAGKKEAAEKFAALEAKYQAILTKHGLAEKMKGEAPMGADGAEAAKALLEGVDQIALLSDLNGFLDALGDEAQGQRATSHGPITGLKIDGDRATAESDGKPVEMVRVGGRWFARLPEGVGGP